MRSPKIRRGFATLTLHQRRNVLRIHGPAQAEAILAEFIADGWEGMLESYNVGVGDKQEVRARVVAMLLSGELVVTREEELRPLDPPRVEPLNPDTRIDADAPAVVEPRTWIAIRVVDQTGRPVLHALPKLRLTDGTEVSRPLGPDGRLRIDGFRPDGDCELELAAVRPETNS